jgi:hypothetical protein
VAHRRPEVAEDAVSAAEERRFRRPPKRSRSRRVYGPRWQIESGFSRSKRFLGSTLRARKWVNQKKEIQLCMLTYNLMLLAA